MFKCRASIFQPSMADNIHKTLLFFGALVPNYCSNLMVDVKDLT